MLNSIKLLIGGGRILRDDGVNICYSDESGMGEEPIATMVGIIVDAGRMHLTKEDWCELLRILNSVTRRTITELKTSDFYSGNGVWRDLDGNQRARVIESVFEWLIRRKHHIVYSSVLKKSFYEGKNNKRITDEVNTIWRFLGFHVTLAIQKYSQPEKMPKGNTILIFDNEEQQRKRFIEVVKNPPSWSNEYYAKKRNKPSLDQIVDVPHFADSKDFPLLQVADFLAFFMRRYAEIKEGLVPPNYIDEEERLSGWLQKLCERIIPCSHIYPKTGRKAAHELFYRYASPSLRDL